MPEAPPPIATYRLQLHAGFDFEAAATVASYLRDLGVSHVYTSPVLEAAPGSTHGYDVIDHTRVNPELGGESAYWKLRGALDAAGLRHLLDIVPNHMAIGTRGNRWWWDVLANGPASRWAGHFDVDWDPPERKLRGTVLLPVLGDHYGRVLEAGELRVDREGAEFVVRYHDHVFPLAPRTLDAVLGPAAERRGSPVLAYLADAFAALPHARLTDPVQRERRHRDAGVLGALLARAIDDEPSIGRAVDEAIAVINADVERLDALLDRQNYRLARWRVAGHELDYRRFFDVDTLAGLRMEDPQVFDDTHALVLALVRDGSVAGLRIDHVDGLRDPQAYLDRLAEAAPGTWLLVEKILEEGEVLPGSWPVAGTTGYEFCTVVTQLFVDAAGEGPLTEAYARFTGDTAPFEEVAHRAKHQVLRTALAADLARCTELLARVCEGRRDVRDYTRAELSEALEELAASFPVYRTYVGPGGANDDDVAVLGVACEEARRRRPELDGGLVDFVSAVLLRRLDGPAEFELADRFQQLTGPVMAKGVEDTAFYASNRLVALNEVGGRPETFGMAPQAFHEANAIVDEFWPSTLLATSTHDTKRGEDVRARIVLLSEVAGHFAAAADRWSSLGRRHELGGLPDRATQWLIFQTLVGAWPIDAGRLVEYLRKATREAKLRTSWTDPDAHFEDAVAAYVTGLLDDQAFVRDLTAFVEPLVAPGRTLSLAQTLLKCTSPGVPDVYQGCELWESSLVDPDNRRPVDFETRRRLLAELGDLRPADIAARLDEGLPKLWVLRQALRVRRAQPDAFRGYEQLAFDGPKAAHGVGHVRGGRVATIVPRLVLGLGGDWATTTVGLPLGRWHNALTGDDVDGGKVRVADLLDVFPVALLERG